MEISSNGSGGRNYRISGRSYPSVATILDRAFPRPHLVGWASSMAAKAALAGGFEGMSEEEIHRRVQRAPYRWMRYRGAFGPLVHSQLESALAPAAEGVRPLWRKDGDAARYIEAARAFCSDYLIGVYAVETIVYSDRIGYAGTADLWAQARKGGGVTVADWKIGKGIYPDHALQLAAYAGADRIIHSGRIWSAPEAEAGAVVRLAEDGTYEARWLRASTLAEHLETFKNLVRLSKLLEDKDRVWDAERQTQNE